jgi:hypothetical protein
VTLHDLLNRHVADTKNSRWDSGHFVTSCATCGREMVKPPGSPWRLR